MQLKLYALATMSTVQTSPITFGQLARQWALENAKRLKRRPLQEAIRLLSAEVPAEFMDAPADSITRPKWHALFKAKAERPGIRRVTHSHVRRIYRWGMSECLCELDPTQGLRSPVPPPRTRMLTDSEVSAIWWAVGELGLGGELNDYGRCLRMLMATGQRRSEIGGLRWSELELHRPDGPAIVLPPERFKSNVPHVIPLNALAVTQLPSSRGRAHVFGHGVGTANEPGGFDGFGKYKAELDALLPGMAPWVVHDFRRVVRSKMAALRVPDNVAELCIGHGKKGMARIYDQHTYQSEMRLAFRLWGEELARIVGWGDRPQPEPELPAPEVPIRLLPAPSL
jgi:integrase